MPVLRACAAQACLLICVRFGCCRASAAAVQTTTPQPVRICAAFSAHQQAHMLGRSCGSQEQRGCVCQLSLAGFLGSARPHSTAARAPAMPRLLCCGRATPADADKPPPPAPRRWSLRRAARAPPSPPPPPPPAPPPPPLTQLPDDEPRCLPSSPADTFALNLSLMGAHPHPAKVGAPFAFFGAHFTRGAAHVRVRCATGATTELLFAWVAEWLCEPAEAVTLLLHTAGGTALTKGEAAGRSLAEVGLARARYAVVLLAPRCGICLEYRPAAQARPPVPRAHAPLVPLHGAPDGAGWTCRGLGTATVHYFCAPCLRAYLESLLAPAAAAGAPPPARLRCPHHACPRVLSDADFRWLLGAPRLAEYQAARARRHADRLQDVQSGREGGDGLARWAEKHAQPCPACSVLIQRAEGCRHIQCLCGATFFWAKGP